MNAKLLTRNGELVTEFLMPPFQLTPEVAFWGNRVFVLDHDNLFGQKFGDPYPAIYREACLWSVDASKALVAEQGGNHADTP